MRPALYTVLTGVVVLAFVAAVLVVLRQSEPRRLGCPGPHSIGPNGEIGCGISPAVPESLWYHPDYR
jgi:hypothetical protein